MKTAKLSKLLILGHSEGEVPVVMDTVFSEIGLKEFDIIKNLDLPDYPFYKELYQARYWQDSIYNFQENSEHPVYFGSLHSHIKYILFHYFQKKHQIGQNRYLTIKAPSIYLSPSFKTGPGLLVQPQVVVSSFCEFGFGVTIKKSSAISHHAKFEDFVTISPGVTISGFVSIGEGTEIGSGAVISNNISIGKHSFIGAGSVVTKNIPDGVIAYGNPCKVIRPNERWEKVKTFLKELN